MRLDLALAPEPDVVAEALAWAETQTVGLQPGVRDRLLLALGEAVSNAARHGDGSVWVDLVTREGRTTAAVGGVGPGLTEARLHKASLPESHRQTHGRGLYLMRSLADGWRLDRGALVLEFDGGRAG